tara:strand:+ start:295 stop:741 length:447 start_codon:yes stop_codon:yes gene_type:complete
MDNNRITAVTNEQLRDFADLIGGSPWGVDKGKPRIYMKSSDDRSVFFKFDDWPTGDFANMLGGAALSCYITDSGQQGDWYRAQKADVARRLRPHALALAAAANGSDGMQLANKIMDDAREISEIEADAAARSLANGDVEAASRTLGLS